MTLVRPAREADLEAWLALRRTLWPDCPAANHRVEIEQHLAGRLPHGEAAAFVAVAGSEKVVAFAEVSLRAYAEGCGTSPVTYLEGWFVAEEVRGRGLGALLLEACEDWGRARGCREIASDAEADNEVSRRAHGALGFEDLGLVRLFRKSL